MILFVKWLRLRHRRCWIDTIRRPQVCNPVNGRNSVVLFCQKMEALMGLIPSRWLSNRNSVSYFTIAIIQKIIEQVEIERGRKGGVHFLGKKIATGVGERCVIGFVVVVVMRIVDVVSRCEFTHLNVWTNELAIIKSSRYHPVQSPIESCFVHKLIL